MSWRYLSLSARQVSKIEKHFAHRGVQMDREHVANVFEFWHQNMSLSHHLDRQHKPIDQTTIINQVLINKEPDLLLIDIDGMKKRLNQLEQLQFLFPLDRLNVFREAPRAWFLQDWTDFSKKFNFVQFRVIRWILKKEKEKHPEPHPLVDAPQVLEKTYEHIKARYFFVTSAGIHPTQLTSKDGEKLVPHKILRHMILTDNPYFLYLVAPGVREEELEFFEEMMAETELPEDEIMDQLSDLTKDVKHMFDYTDDPYFRKLAKLGMRKIEA